MTVGTPVGASRVLVRVPAGPRSSARRLPVLLGIDVSGSAEAYLSALGAALQQWLTGIRMARELSGVVDVAILTFGGAGAQWLDPATGLPSTDNVPHIAPVTAWQAPQLAAGGHTPLDAALEQLLDVHRVWLEQASAVRHYLPVMWFVTDGVPCTPDLVADASWRRHLTELREREANGHLAAFCARPEFAELAVLDDLAPRATVPLSMDMAMLLQLISISAQSAREGSNAAARVRQAMIDLGLIEL